MKRSFTIVPLADNMPDANQSVLVLDRIDSPIEQAYSAWWRLYSDEKILWTTDCEDQCCSPGFRIVEVVNMHLKQEEIIALVKDGVRFEPCKICPKKYDKWISVEKLPHPQYPNCESMKNHHQISSAWALENGYTPIYK